MNEGGRPRILSLLPVSRGTDETRVSDLSRCAGTRVWEYYSLEPKLDVAKVAIH